MNCRIIPKDEFHIIGFRKRITLQFSGENHQIDSLYAQMNEENRKKLLLVNDVQPEGIISVSSDFSDRTKEGSELDQWLGVASSSSALEGFEALEVPSSDWAVFTSCGPFPQALQETWAEIYFCWLASSGYTLTGGPEILRNIDVDTSKPDFSSEIWISVRKKTV